MSGRVQPPVLDPFRTLAVQSRLSRLAREMEALDNERAPRFAMRHHALAATRAYDQTLAEACALAGLTLAVDGPADRLLAEASLVQAGWTW